MSAGLKVPFLSKTSSYAAMNYSNSTVNSVPVFEFEPGIDIHTHLNTKDIDISQIQCKIDSDLYTPFLTTCLFDHLQPYLGVPSPCQFLDSILFNFSCPLAQFVVNC